MMFMLKQQHYTLTKVKKSEIIINHPFKVSIFTCYQVDILLVLEKTQVTELLTSQ